MKKDTHNKAYEDTYEVLSRSIFFILLTLMCGLTMLTHISCGEYAAYK